MNRRKLEVVKRDGKSEHFRVNILGISELEWTGMGEFNSDDHCIYCCGQESLRINGVAIIVKKKKKEEEESEMLDLDVISKMTE